MAIKPTTTTTISEYSDPSLAAGANSFAFQTANGNIFVYETTANIYVTEVQQTTNQQFITNLNAPAAGSGGIPGSIQFNIDGNLGASPYLTFNRNTQQLTTSSFLATGQSILGLPGSVKIYGGANGQVLTTDGTGNLSWNTAGGIPAAGSNTQVQFNNNGAFGASAGLTFVSGTGLLTASAISTSTLTTSVANLGSINNVKISGGSNGQALVTDGTGNLSFASTTGIGTVTSVGVSSNTLTVTNSPITSSGVINIELPSNPLYPGITSNSYSLGNDSNNIISTQRWFEALSIGGAPDQLIYSTPAANVASLDFHITATDSTVARQVTKILAVNLGSTTTYTEYGTMAVGAQVADYVVQQVAGNIQLTVTPATASTVQYNIVLTIYNS
jgi:hypothetical protein